MTNQFDENMSPEIEIQADQWEEQQQALREIAEAEAQKVILMIVWTDEDGDEKTEEINCKSVDEADALWEEVGNTFSDDGRWMASDFEILDE